MKTICKTAAVCVGLVWLALQICPNASAGNVRLGLLTPSTGATPEWGKKQVTAMTMARDHINRRGGVLGNSVEVTVYDTSRDPDKAVALYRRLSQTDKVLAVVGPHASNECIKVFPVTSEEKLVAISPASALPGLSNLSVQPFAFRINVPSSVKEELLIRTWCQNTGVKQVAIVYDAGDSTTRAIAEKVWPQLFHQMGVQVMQPDRPLSFNTGERNFEELARRLAQLSPDGIGISALMHEAGFLLKALRQQGLMQPAVGATQTKSSALVDIAGKAAEDFWSVGIFNKDDPRPKVQSYVTEFTSRCSQAYPDMACEPDRMDVTVYDTFHFLADVMKRAHISNLPQDLEKDRRKIRDGLADMQVWRGVSGMMSFNEKGDGIRSIYILKVKNGRWVRAF